MHVCVCTTYCMYTCSNSVHVPRCSYYCTQGALVRLLLLKIHSLFFTCHWKQGEQETAQVHPIINPEKQDPKKMVYTPCNCVDHALQSIFNTCRLVWKTLVPLLVRGTEHLSYPRRIPSLEVSKQPFIPGYLALNQDGKLRKHCVL